MLKFLKKSYMKLDFEALKLLKSIKTHFGSIVSSDKKSNLYLKFLNCC